MIVEGFRVQDLSVCIDVLHKLKLPKMFQVQRCELFTNKGYFFLVNYYDNYFVEFWHDMLRTSAYQVPCK